MAGNGRHTEKRRVYAHMLAGGASAGSPGGAGGDICLWQFRKMALMRRRRGQHQFHLVQFADSQLLETLRRAPVRLIRGHTLQDML